MADPRLVAAVRDTIYEALHPGQRSGQLADRLAEAVVERLGVEQVGEWVHGAEGPGYFRQSANGDPRYCAPAYRVRVLESSPDTQEQG